MTKTSNQFIFCGLLAFVSVILKLCGIFNSSWWWILSPLWIPIAVGLLFGAFYLLIKYRKAPVKSKWVRKWYMAMYKIIEDSK